MNRYSQTLIDIEREQARGDEPALIVQILGAIIMMVTLGALAFVL